MKLSKEELPDYILDLKSIRNAIYAVGDGKNPYDRSVLLKHACEVAHNITEKWKKRSQVDGMG